MFQFGRSRLLNLWIQLRIVRHYSDWVAPFGYLRFNAFFQLTGAFRRFRVLLRLLMPRHPPIALNSLTKYILVLSIKSFELRLVHFRALCHYLEDSDVYEDYPQALIFISDFVFVSFL